MKVTSQETDISRKRAAKSVTITLTDMEAGYLRRILGGIHTNASADKVFNELDRYIFPEYEEQYPRWRQAMEDNRDVD